MLPCAEMARATNVDHLKFSNPPQRGAAARMARLLALSFVVLSCAADRAPDALGRVRQGMFESCVESELTPWRTYDNPDTGMVGEAHDVTRTSARPFLFHIPSAADVTDGNAGQGEVLLEIAIGEDVHERCFYRGVTEESHPTEPQDVYRGLRYLFDYCENGHQHGDGVEADKLTLHIESGDELAGTTAVAMKIQEDPEQCLPVGYLDGVPIDPTRPTELVDLVRHLYQGANPIQLDVVAEAIPDDEVSLIKGYVVDDTGAPLPQLWVGIDQHPEYGWTTTRSDGAFDIVVRGGRPLALQIKSAADQLRVIRWVDPHVHRTRFLGKLTVPASMDPAVDVDLEDPAGTYAWGGLKVDKDGARRAAMYFPPGLEMYANGSQLTTFSLMLMERTVGASESTMPAPLNPTSAFTYAADFLVTGHATDEITFAHATNKTPVFYVQSFVGAGSGKPIPSCAPVPMGYYDAKENRWIPTPTGRVIRLFGVTSDGFASVDADGDGDQDDADDLAIVPDEERKILAKMIDPPSGRPRIFDPGMAPSGLAVWRVPVEHFTTYDANMGIFLKASAGAPPASAGEQPFDENADCHAGSIIECQNATLGERIPIAGTPLALTYRSDKMLGDTRDYRLDIPIGPKDSAATEDLLRIDVEIDILSQQVDKKSYYPEDADPTTFVGLTHPFRWDGKLAGYEGRVRGRQTAAVTVRYAYKATYTAPQTFGATGSGFGTVAGGGGGGGGAAIRPMLTTTPARTEIIVSKTFDVSVGTMDWQGLGIGGWGVDLYHTWSNGQLLMGNGARVSGNKLGHASIRRLQKDTSPPQIVGGDSVLDVAAGPDGTLWALIQVGWTPKLFRAPPAGSASAPRTLQEVTTGLGISRIAVDPDGNTFVCADAGSKVYRIDGTPSSKSPYELVYSTVNVVRIAGGGTGGLDSGDGGDPKNAVINCAKMTAERGGLYIFAYNRIRRIETGSADGLGKARIDHFAGCGAGTYGKVCTQFVRAEDCACGKTAAGEPCANRDLEEGRPLATDVPLAWPTTTSSFDLTDLAAGPDGALYYLLRHNGSTATLHRITRDGRTRHVAGNKDASGPLRETADARLSPIPPDARIAVDADGVVYVAATIVPPGCASAVTRTVALNSDGAFRMVAGGGSSREKFTDGADAAALSLSGIQRIAATRDKFGNHVFLAGAEFLGPTYCNSTGVVVDVSSLISLNAVTTAAGSEVFVKNGPFGHHTQTVDAFSGIPKFTFGHDSAGRLTTITDAAGNTTTLVRDPGRDYRVSKIVGPYGNASASSSGSGVTILEYESDTPGAYLKGIWRAPTEGYTFTYSSTLSGLLASFKEPGAAAGDEHKFSFVGSGAYQGDLLTDSQPASTGGKTTISRYLRGVDGWTSMLTSALGQKKTFHFDRKITDAGTRVEKQFIANDLATTKTNIQPNGSTETISPTGTISVFTPTPDPRFGMQAPLGISKTTLPSGLSKTVTVTRTVVPFGDTGVSQQEETTQLKASDSSTVATFKEKITQNSGGYLVEVTSAKARRLQYQLNAAGQVQSLSFPDPEWGIATINLDRDSTNHGRLTAIRQGASALERKVSLDYRTSESWLDKLTLNTTTPFVTSFTTYDPVGRVKALAIPTASGGTTSIAFEFDLNGNLKTLSPPDRPTALHEFTATAIDLPRSYKAPAATTSGTRPETRYDWDADGALAKVTLADANTVTLVPDSYRRLEKVLDSRAPAMSTRLEYDTGPSKQLKHLRWPEATSACDLQFVYDGHLLKSSTWSGATCTTSTQTVTRTFDGMFRMRGLTVFGSTASYDYDEDALLTNAGGLEFNYKPNTSLLWTTTYGALREEYAYNGFGELRKQTTTASGLSLLTIDYEPETPRVDRDKLGRIVRRDERIRKLTSGEYDDRRYKYDYNAAGRLWRVYEGTPATALVLKREYVYGANGSRDEKRIYASDGTTVAATEKATDVDQQDRLRTYNGTSYDYLESGELAKKTEPGASLSTVYSWDARGSLLRVTVPTGPSTSKTIDYIVDPLGRRIGKKIDSTQTKQWVWDGQLRIVGEIDITGGVTTTTRFVYGRHPNVPELAIRGGVTYRIFTDHLGSVRLVVDSAGSVVARMDYDEFGIVTKDEKASSSWIDLPFGFAGGLYDRDTQLARFGARDYDAVTGRWISKDPAGLAGGLNLYGYANNDPVNYIDSDGESATMALPFFGAGFGGGGSAGALGAAGPVGAVVSAGIGGFAVGWQVAKFLDKNVYERLVPQTRTEWGDSYSKGGKKNVKETDLIGVAVDELIRRRDEAKRRGDTKEAKRIDRHLKGLGERNKAKRGNKNPFGPGLGFPGWPWGDDDEDDDCP